MNLKKKILAAIIVIYHYYYFAMLGMGLGALYMLGKSSITKPNPQLTIILMRSVQRMDKVV